jgi:hypothetical protein
MLVELRLNDLIEAAIDGSEAFVHLFAEAADLDMHSVYLIAHVGADVIAFFFDETRKLLELGFFVLWHAGQYTILMDSVATGSVGAESASLEFAKRRRNFQGPDLQKDKRVPLFG